MSNGRALRRLRSCPDRELRKLLLAAVGTGARYKMTTSGVMFFGPAGTATAHLSGRDHRTAENFRSHLRAAGIPIEKGK